MKKRISNNSYKRIDTVGYIKLWNIETAGRLKLYFQIFLLSMKMKDSNCAVNTKEYLLNKLIFKPLYTDKICFLTILNA